MTASMKPGREAAIEMLDGAAKTLADIDADMSSPVDRLELLTMSNLLANFANVNALLAIESRLGELVEQQRIANAPVDVAPRSTISFPPGMTLEQVADALTNSCTTLIPKENHA
ncbi:hypothetical protein [Nocardia sp. NPDC058633]|uniref:hypothetical protein n=1 Tax=Nocardia sp. NPDC058633 TaxID=3346568 RepID=UPI00364AB8C6